MIDINEDVLVRHSYSMPLTERDQEELIKNILAAFQLGVGIVLFTNQKGIDYTVEFLVKRTSEGEDV